MGFQSDRRVFWMEGWGKSCVDATTDPNRDAVLHYTGDDFLRAPVQAANLNLGASSEGAVDALPPAPTGIYDSMGNVWVWCETQGWASHCGGANSSLFAGCQNQGSPADKCKGE